MKKVAIIFSLVLFSLAGFAQTKTDHFSNDSEVFNKPEDELSVPSLSFQQRSSFGMMAGTGVAAFSRGNAMVNSFIAPHFNYRLSSRLNISAAAVFGNTQFGGRNDLNFNGGSGFNSRGLMMGMDYRISDKVSIGAGFQMHQGMGSFNNAFGNQFGQPFARGFSPFMGW
jgi:hypothetical protein